MPNSKQLVIYQLKISILDISPTIWRRVKVRSGSTIADLHYIIQIAMGWKDSHLHRFNLRRWQVVNHFDREQVNFRLQQYATGDSVSRLFELRIG
jgi:Plasmid pRiA4b ORF-3-like protein